MGDRKARGPWLGLLGAVWLFACHDSDRVRSVEATAVFEPQVLDFGEVPVGVWSELPVRVQNLGYVPFNVTDALRLDENPDFHAEVLGPGRVAPGESKVVRVRFRPLREGPSEETVRIELDAEHQPPSPVRVHGIGAPLQIEVSPRTLDFETLELESDRTLRVVVKNPSDLPLTLGVRGEADAAAFTASAVNVPPMATLELDVRFAPGRIGQVEAGLELSPCGDCTPTRVGLEGRAVKSALVFDPEPVPFDDIPVHERTRSQTKVTNVIWREVSVSAVSTSDPAFSALTPLAGRAFAPGDQVEVDLEFAARFSGPNMGLLELDYRSDRARRTQVVLDARGGRPQLSIAPVAIDFGELPVGAKAERTVRLTNAGTQGALHFQGLSGRGPDPLAFGASVPRRDGEPLEWTAGTAWPALTAEELPIAPGADYLDVTLYFEPTAPGAFTATAVFHSDDMFNPERTVTLQGEAYEVGPCAFSVAPAGALDFGNVPPGSAAVLGFHFENPGPGVCALKDIHLSDDGGGAFRMPGGPITGGVLAPHTAFSSQIAFRPPGPGSFEGELSISVNDPESPVFRLPVRGASRETCLTAAPAYLDFGPIRYDCSPTPLTTFVSNQCSEPLTVTGSWIGAGTSDQYAIVATPSHPLTLGPAEGFELEIAYARNVLGQHYSPLYVRALGEPDPLLVALLAETNHEGLMTERFVQGTDSLLDVLFVVSNTSTMQPYQDRLRAALPGWIDRVRGRGVDMRAGVTTTGLVPRGSGCPGGASGGEAGRLFPVNGHRARVVSSRTSDAAPVLQQNIQVGVCHNLVQGLETLRQALSSPLLDSADDPRTVEPNDGNLGLVRPAAQLAVVVVADEDDHSGFGPEGYAQFLQAFKGPGMSHRTQLHAIVPTDPACLTAGPPGPRFGAVAAQTGGQVLNVCSGDYGGLLDAIAERAAAPQADFPLSETPTGTGEMTVRVDGALAAGDSWRYDEASNSVIFSSAAIPVPGQRVEVRYRAVCRD